MPQTSDVRAAVIWLLIAGISPRQKAALMQLIKVRQVTALNAKQMLEAIYDACLKSHKESLRDIDFTKVVVPQESEIQTRLKIQKDYPIQVVFLGDQAYPAMLNEISGRPLCLFCIGNIDLLQQPQIAIVGSRHASANGAYNAYHFAASCCRQGLVVTSGMALGVDAQAHTGALSVNQQTIAVLGTGVDVVYPKRHQELYHNIAKAGLIISEFMPGTEPLREHFPQRNRIIAGMSLGTLVVEAGIRSGSLITARMAVDFGRDVFAIPGSVHSARSKGCHFLLRQGAVLVESAEDVFAEIQWNCVQTDNNLPLNGQNTTHPGLKGVAKQVYDLIDYEPTDIDVLASQTELSVQQLMQALLELELNGLICVSSGMYQRELS